jgi:hypothetical protein
MRDGLLQRKCACGGSGAAGLTGECEDCGKKKLAGLQTKLMVGSPADPLEEEADRLAERVMHMPAPGPRGQAPPAVRRQAVTPVGPAPAAAFDAPPAVEQTLSSPGRPLDTQTRAFMESRFGHDFGRVRVHADDHADASARAVDALAYTVGDNVVFAAGQYAPDTTEGRRLLAHELTHVLQQGGGGRAAAGAAAGPVQSRPRDGAFLQRQPKPRKKATILSAEEIKADPTRKKSYEWVGQPPKAKVCRVTGLKPPPNNCPAELKPGAEVTIISGEPGGGWLSIENTGTFSGFGNKEPTNILGVFAKEIPTAAVPKRSAPTPAKDAPAELDESRKARENAASVAAGVTTPERYKHLKCIVEKGGCPTGISREAGVPEVSEIEGYNAECKKETGYTGADVSPTEDECKELSTTEGLDFVGPERLAQLKKLLDAYVRLIQSGALEEDALVEIDNRIASAEKQLQGLSGSDQTPAQTSGGAPWVVADAKGGPAPPPTTLAAAGAALPMAVGRFSLGVASRGALAAGSRIPALLVLAGLVVMTYLYLDYKIRKNGAGAIEALIGALITMLAKFSDPATDKKIKEAIEAARKAGKGTGTGTGTGPKPKPDPKPGPKPGPGTDPIPYDPIEDEEPGYKCPTGLEESDAIGMIWVKPLKFYKRPLYLDGGRYEHNIPKKLKYAEKKLGAAFSTIGVADWPVVGSTLKKGANERNKSLLDKYREALNDEGFDEDLWKDYSPDHVRDVGLFSGLDHFLNLWPMEREPNMRAGKWHSGQLVCYRLTKASRTNMFEAIGSTRLDGRWFKIRMVADPPP